MQKIALFLFCTIIYFPSLTFAQDTMNVPANSQKNDIKNNKNLTIDGCLATSENGQQVTYTRGALRQINKDLYQRCNYIKVVTSHYYEWRDVTANELTSDKNLDEGIYRNYRN